MAVKATKAKGKPVKKRVVKKAPVKKAKNFDKDFELICMEIEKGISFRRACPAFMSYDKFYSMLADPVKSERYARACEGRADILFDQIIDISDNSSSFDEPVNVQRDRLKIDARKWVLSKMAPKKYGDKIDVTSDGEKIQSHVTIFELPDNGRGA